MTDPAAPSPQPPPAPDPAVLSRIGLADHLPLALLHTLAEQATVLELAAGEDLETSVPPAESHPADDGLYLLVDGDGQRYSRWGEAAGWAVDPVQPGQWVGVTPLVVGGTPLLGLRATTPCRLWRWSRPEVATLLGQSAGVRAYFMTQAQGALRRLRFALVLRRLFGPHLGPWLADLQRQGTWQQLRRGEQLFAEGDAGDRLYIVLSGRLNAVIARPGQDPKIAPITDGDVLGDLAILTGDPRSASVFALRDSVLVSYDRALCHRLFEQYPDLLLKLTQRVAQRFKQQERGDRSAAATATLPNRRTLVLAHAPQPSAPTIPLADFTDQLTAALAVHGPVLRLNRTVFQQVTGSVPLAAALDQGLETELSQDLLDQLRYIQFQLWLTEQEATYPFILLEGDAAPEADPEAKRWTDFCLGQADRLLWVAWAEADCTPSPLEQAVNQRQRPETRLEQTLVLLHPPEVSAPRHTRRWLDGRSLDQHHHLRWGDGRHMARLGRFLLNRAVGVALGGGGGRGAAHYGMLQALADCEVPVDMVGGTSIGGLVAAQYASEQPVADLKQRSQTLLEQTSPFSAYTVPMLALMDHKRLDAMLQALYGDQQIEDLWLNFFCVSTNISQGRKVVHRVGPLWRAVRATIALPGIFAPYIDDGDLLIDGGGLDSDPSLTLAELNPGPIILCSVAPRVVAKVPFTYDQLPSALTLFRRWLLPWQQPVDCPNLADVLAMSMGVDSIKNCEQSFATADLVLMPPLDDYGILDFAVADTLYHLAYDYALGPIRAWAGQRGTPDAPPP